jgi:hypothetical protein
MKTTATLLQACEQPACDISPSSAALPHCSGMQALQHCYGLQGSLQAGSLRQPACGTTSRSPAGTPAVLQPCRHCHAAAACCLAACVDRVSLGAAAPQQLLQASQQVLPLQIITADNAAATATQQQQHRCADPSAHMHCSGHAGLKTNPYPTNHKTLYPWLTATGPRTATSTELPHFTNHKTLHHKCEVRPPHLFLGGQPPLLARSRGSPSPKPSPQRPHNPGL